MSPSKNKVSKLKQYLDIGMRFSVVFKFANNEEFLTQCSFVGMKNKHFLIFELNSKAMEELITLKTTDVDVILRGVADTEFGHIVAFKTRVVGIKSLGSWLMFLKYPHWVETRVIRKDKRLKINLDSKVTYEGQTINAVIQDFSISGCRLYFDHFVEMEPGKNVKVQLPLENTPKPYPKCSVASCRRDGAGYSVGINFESNIRMSDQLKLEVYELSQLALEVN